MMGNGPPRSGWLMKVVVLPSLVWMSICWSIMAHLFRSVFLRAGPDYHDCGQTAALKDGCRAPDAAQRVALAERCAAEPGPRLLADRRNRGPGSAQQHEECRSASGTRDQP